MFNCPRLGAVVITVLGVCLGIQINLILSDACAQTDAELAPLYEGLDRDIGFWRTQLDAGKLTSADLTLLFSRNAFHWGANPWTNEGAGMANVQYNAVLIKDNKWYFPLREWGYDLDCATRDDWCSLRMTAMQAAFNRWVNDGERFPDVVFVLDLENGGSCRVPEQCPAPTFAIYGVQKGPEYGNMDIKINEGRGSILLPDMTHGSGALEHPPINADWATKAHKAIFRGSLHCPHFHINPVASCSRNMLFELAKNSSDGKQWLEVDGWEEENSHVDDPRMESWQQEFAHYRYTLALDGASGFGRLADLLQINSAILKEHSPIVEHYVRALKANEHYLPILVKDPQEVFNTIRDTPMETAKRIASNAQAFAAKFLCDKARMLYFRRALEQYKSLFSDMDEYIQQQIWPLVQLRQKLGLGHHRLLPWRGA